MGIAKCRVCEGEYQKHDNWRRTICAPCHYQTYTKPRIQAAKPDGLKPRKPGKKPVKPCFASASFGASSIWLSKPIRSTQT